MMLWSARGFDGVDQRVPVITQRIASRLQAGAIVLIHECTPVAVEVAQEVTANAWASAALGFLFFIVLTLSYAREKRKKRLTFLVNLIVLHFY